jgi:hypothetical protein
VQSIRKPRGIRRGEVIQVGSEGEEVRPVIGKIRERMVGVTMDWKKWR